MSGAEQCRLLGAKRKTCALSEVYSFWTPSRHKREDFAATHKLLIGERPG
jgi:hypothetical protein